MTEFIKKYWYVILVSIVFVFGIGAVILNSQAGKVSSKQVDGKYIVSSIDGQNLTADELYELTKDRVEGPLATMIFEKEVIERTYDYNEDQKIEARLEANQVVAQYKSYYGEDKAEDIIHNLLLSMGYSGDDSLENYFLNASATEKLVNDYFETTYQENFIAEEQPMLLSHIIVMPSQEEGLTDEQKLASVQEKMDKVDEALKTQEFAEVAAQLSEDGSAQNGGSLGIVHKSISFHKEFLDAAYQQKVGEVSDWVESPSGFHKILITSNDYDTIKADQGFEQLKQQVYPTLRGEAFMAQAEKLNIDFSANPEFENTLKNAYGLEGAK